MASNKMLFLSGLLALSQLAFAQDESEGSQAPPQIDAGSGLKIGDNMVVSVPTPILILIFLAFVGFMGFIVNKILNFETERDKKKAAKKAEKEERKSASKKGNSKKAD